MTSALSPCSAEHHAPVSLRYFSGISQACSWPLAYAATNSTTLLPSTSPAGVYGRPSAWVTAA